MRNLAADGNVHVGNGHGPAGDDGQDEPADAGSNGDTAAALAAGPNAPGAGEPASPA
jgi:hypothetical protein